MCKDTYNIGIRKSVSDKKNSYKENKSFFKNEMIKERIFEKKEYLLNEKSKEKINIEERIEILPNKSTEIQIEENKLIQTPKLGDFWKFYDVTEIKVNESMSITTENSYKEILKVLSWTNTAGVYNDINSMELQEDRKISINSHGILLENGYNHKISLGSTLQIHNSIFISEKNERKKILLEELEKLGIEKEISSEIDNLKKYIKKIKNEKVYRKQIKEKFNQYFEKIEKNKKIINNKISEAISNKFYFEKRIEEDKKISLENRILTKNINFLILSAINMRKNPIKELLFKPENNNAKYFEILSKEKMLRKQTIKENKSINSVSEEKEWDFIFDGELLVYSYINRIRRHTKVMSYDLKMINSIYKLDILEYNQNKDEIMWQEKDSVIANTTKNSSENKVIDLPGYLKTLHLLEGNNESNEKEKIGTSIKKSILENQEKTFKTKEKFVEKRSNKKIEIPVYDRMVSNVSCQSPYEEKKMEMEEINKEISAKKRYVNDRITDNQFNDAKNYLTEVDGVFFNDKNTNINEENYINESNSYYTKRYKYVF